MSAGTLKRLAQVGASVVIGLAALLVLEGLASIILVLLETVGTQPFAEQFHTEYDPELGWVNRPDVSLPDLYGPGRDFTTNVQRTRNTHPFSADIPVGRSRVACSGDSFALGYGVGNEEAWCSRLEALAPAIEAVNLGQGGYGIDQSYLWARRALAELALDVHLFSFVCDDFDRMRATSLYGFGKPVLRASGGELQVGNVPVPRTGPLAPWAARLMAGARRLRSVELGRALVGLHDEAAGADSYLDATATRETALEVFRHLAAFDRERGALLVLVFLPGGHMKPGETCSWMDPVRRGAGDGEWLLVDLVDGGPLDRSSRDSFLIAEGEVPVPGASGHYNARGNDVVARSLLEHLLAIPAVRDRLAR